MNEQEKAFRKDLKALLMKYDVHIGREDSGRGGSRADWEINYYQPSEWKDGELVREGFDFTKNYFDGSPKV